MSDKILPSNLTSGGDAKRNILMGVAVVVIVGGVLVSFFMKQNTKDKDLILNEGAVDQGVSSTTSYEGEDSVTPGYQIFVGDDLGFQMDYPSDWTVDTSSSYVNVSFMSPISEEDVFAENVNFTTEDLTSYPGTTLEDYAAAALGQIATAMPEYVLVEQGNRTLGEYEAGYFLGDYPLAGYDVEVLSVFAIVDEMAYIITYTGEVGTHDQYTGVVDTMLASFKLL
ncbi:MAG: hypothetical protein WC882_04140 [Candidatus Gracilibacteria bacterium]